MPITEEIKDSNTLVIAFPGFANKLHMPLDEFFLKAGLKTASKIIVYDKSRRKTFFGIPPDFRTFFDVVKHLKTRVNSISPETLICVGTSGGGHPALLYGHLLGANKAIAFSPYPYLSMEMAELMQDHILLKTLRNKFAKHIKRMSAREKKFMDLREVLCNWNKKTEYIIHVSKKHESDLKRAGYLRNLPHTQIIEHPYSAHCIAATLAKKAELSKCFTD